MSEVNERSRLDEAVEVARVAYGSSLPGQERMRSALLAGMKVLLGEALVWQYRGAPNERWVLCPKQSAETFASSGYETRALYAPSLGEGHE